MFERRKRGSYEELPMDDFFDAVELTPEALPSQGGKRGRRYKFLTAPGLILLCSTALALVLVIPLVIGGSLAVQAAAPMAKAWNNVPADLPKVVIGARNTIYDKNGAVIAQVWAENRQPLPNIKAVNSNAINALVDTEDKNFYKNNGFDLKATMRSAVRGTGGGSGITQQLIKNLQYYNLAGKNDKSQAVERSISRKVKELKMSLQYEKDHSKDEILTNYFNTVAFGSPTTYGLDTASHYFFDKSAKDLTLAEATALVGTANNPVIYNMDNPASFDKWKARQKIVLNSMVAQGHITQEQAHSAYEEKLKLVKKKDKGGTCYTSKYPFYCTYVMNYLARSPRLADTVEERNAIIARGGLQIKTYMDPAAMKTMDDYMKKNWTDKNRIVAPTAVVQPGTGGVSAIAVNRQYGVGKGKTEIDLANQPSGEGSVYKMFTLAAALQEKGMTESDLAFSSRCPLYPGRNYDSPPGGFTNSNSCAMQGGYMNYKRATAVSSNTWFVTLEMKIGVNAVKEFSKKVGLAAPDYIDNRSLSYTLGSVSNSPVNMAAAFATFSNKGIYCPATPIASMTYGDGSEPPLPDKYDPKAAACRSVMSPQNAGVVLKAMRANVSGEIKDAFGFQAKANIPGVDNGGKSGTNQLLNSSWAQVTGANSLFTNVYDMDQTSRGIDGAVFKGYPHSWHENTATETGSDLMKQLSKGKPNVKLNFNSTDSSLTPTKVDESDYFLVPSVLGMSPGDAVQNLQSLGITTNVSKQFKQAPAGYASGVVAEQSIPAGTKLPKGTKKELTLYVAK